MPGQRRETGTTISRTTAAAITANLLLQLDANDLFALCTATTKPVGQAMDTVDSGEVVGARIAADGIWELTIAAAVTFRAPLYTAAGGKVTPTPVDGCYCIGWALREGLADGDVIPVLPAVTPFLVQDLDAVTYAAPGALTYADPAAITYVAPEAGAVNTGDAGSDTVITSLRTQLIALAADVVAIRTKLLAAGVDLGVIRTAVLANAVDDAANRAALVASGFFKT
jgi:hypothetical protein